jgi:IS5 family transposase
MNEADVGLNLTIKHTREREFLDQMNRVVSSISLVELITPYGTEGKMTLPLLASLSGILCARHSMTTRSMNATQDKDRCGGQDGAAANSG